MLESSRDTTTGTKDAQTVTPSGDVIGPRIAGVGTRPLKTQLDDRGEVCELASADWPELAGVGSPHVYLSTARSGVAKGWVRHMRQTDRLALIAGVLRVVLFDGRENSPTHGVLMEVYGGERSRLLVTIPPGVWHTVQNVGDNEAMFVNAPDRPYLHEDPDKFRLPLNTELIPYTFESRRL